MVEEVDVDEEELWDAAMEAGVWAAARSAFGLASYWRKGSDVKWLFSLGVGGEGGAVAAAPP